MSTVKQHQKTKTIRKYQDAQFLICNSCFWCASNLAGNLNHVENCPACRSHKMDIIPISEKEAYMVYMNGNNISMEFWNQL